MNRGGTMVNILTIFLILSTSFGYDVGDTISEGHQSEAFDICYAPELDPNGDGQFQFAEYNGDLNGGQYFVIFLEMMATW